ncbi:MAG: hypothetical protein K8I02_03345, partial [Candidatus Methylomirabilis sp.]|nr:hypothetical protein [Deltaproteobacteria bacterium]
MVELRRPREILILKKRVQRRAYLGLERDRERVRLSYFSRSEDLLAAVDRRTGDAILAHMDDLCAHAEALAFCKRMKAHGRARDLPLLLIGRFHDKAEATDLLRAGADELLPEEVDPEYGRARLEVWLRMRERLDDLSRAKRKVQE